MSRKDVEILEYFYYNTTSEWLVRLTDDAFVNINNLENLMIEISNLGNPLIEPILQAHCIDYKVRPVFQGGSGILMSRKAVQLFLSNAEEWLRGLYHFEDWHFADFIFKLGISFDKISSDRFLGHSFSQQDLFDLLHGYKFHFPKCINSRPNFCLHKPRKISDLVFLHDMSRKTTQIQFKDFFNKYKGDLYWILTDEKVRPCVL